MAKKGQRLISTFMAITILVVGFALGTSFEKVRAAEELETKLEIFLQVLDIVRNDYVEKDVDYTKVVYGAIRGMLKGLDDPYTRFMEPPAYKEMKIRMRGSYSGIGIYIGMKNDLLTVISPIDDTPADKAGLKAGDLIVSVDSKSTEHMALEEAVSLIRGKRGTAVVLGIMRKGMKKPKDYKIVRDNIKIKSVVVKDLSNRKIAYIKLNTFEDQRAASKIREALTQAKKAGKTGLIIDVRNNGGGLLQNAIDIGSMFIKEGPIVYTVDREDRRETLSATGQVVWNMPTVILINGASASASEILAGALKDTKKAKVVGTNSFGKASVQSVRTLNDDSALLITIAKYLTPSGTDINKKGITPDIVVTIPTPEAGAEEVVFKLGDEAEDIQLQKAIKVLEKEMKDAS
ncbi:MAG: S41 family peptidase [Candidatus Margulisbacteria bacterium]|nr:S41 family peptidase [Candidatus Margulisiibacteriota bacterium]MBU1021942.1 S41 family peptidase [Candidatus Margulisiibacteriota bacterium]MBU1728921.1 S41 family peptidase [Candidatus Margulisiibacteriota bacterium]MBU1954727.1 S41 family peptidase [Candidatus Margulisiibacteriota bacterium]